MIKDFYKVFPFLMISSVMKFESQAAVTYWFFFPNVLMISGLECQSGAWVLDIEHRHPRSSVCYVYLYIDKDPQTISHGY